MVLKGTLSILLAVAVVVYYCVKYIAIEGNLFCFFFLVRFLYFIFLSNVGVNLDALTRTDMSTFPVAYGVIIYLFEGIGNVLTSPFLFLLIFLFQSSIVTILRK